MDLIISFLVSVAAGVVSSYICKWLDGDDSDNYPKESPRGDALGLSICVPLGYNLFLSYRHYSICKLPFQYTFFYYFWHLFLAYKP